MTRHTSDLELAERAARGHARATAELVNRALPIVRGLARRLAGDAEEGDALAQEAFAAALEGLNRYRGDAAFATWVCAIAVRKHADLARSAAAEERLRKRPADAGEREPGEIVADKDSAHRLWQLVVELPQAHRDAIIARATSEGAADAAVRLGITTNAMRVRLHRARLALRELLLARYPDWSEEVSHAKR